MRAWVAVLSLCVAGCGLDHAIFGEMTRGGQQQVPGAGKTIVFGLVDSDALKSAPVTFYAASGTPVEGYKATVDDNRRFEIAVPGATELSNLVFEARQRNYQAVGLVPTIPRKPTVFEPDPVVSFGELGALMASLGNDSTTVTLLVLAKARDRGGLGTVAPSSVKAALSDLRDLLGQHEPRLEAVRGMVQKLAAAPTAPWRLFAKANESFLDGAAVASGFDYAGDGAAETTTADFDAALAAALDTFIFRACYPEDRIRVVLQADFRPGQLDRNCTPLDRFRWAKDAPGKALFVTGGIHETTPRCATGASPCLDDAAIDAATQQLGNWKPNVVKLSDDGQNGDAVAGDGIWTAAFDLPWFKPSDATSAGVRIGYKYTWGLQGQGWTASEEWPGNKRILELRDVNGDQIITRVDRFGDETTNKDKSNLLSPGNQGCGGVALFPDEYAAYQQKTGKACLTDTLESKVDTNGDCKTLDEVWPKPGLVAPITVDCPQP